MNHHEFVSFIISVVCRECNAVFLDMKCRMSGGSKTANTVMGRSAAAHLLHKYADMSYPDIARVFGGAGHSSLHTAALHYPRLPEVLRVTMEMQIELVMPRPAKVVPIAPKVAARQEEPAPPPKTPECKTFNEAYRNMFQKSVA